MTFSGQKILAGKGIMTNNVDPDKLLHPAVSTLGLYYWYSETCVKWPLSKRPTIVLLFDLILYVPSTIFQLNRDRPSWVEPVLS